MAKQKFIGNALFSNRKIETLSEITPSVIYTRKSVSA